MKKVNWLSILLRAVAMAPTVVEAVEAIGQQRNLPGMDKKTLAMSALGMSTELAGAIAPEHQQTFSTVQQAVANVIDSVVTVKNATDDWGKSAPSTPPAPAATPAAPAPSGN